MEIRKNRKTREPREHKQPHLVKWELTGIETYGAKVGNYYVEVYEICMGEWEWRTSLLNKKESSLLVSGYKPSKQSAKNAAVFQMNKHKKSLIRKTVNSAN